MADEQQRISGEPTLLVLRRKVHEESVRLLRRATTLVLLLPVCGWSGYAFSVGKGWSSVLNEVAVLLYAAWVTCAAVVYARLVRD